MARTRYVFDKARMMWVLAAEFYGARPAASCGPMVISDIEPYRAVAADKHTGKRPVIGGRRQHREFLRANGYVEVGNDRSTPSRPELSRADRMADIKRALGE